MNRLPNWNVPVHSPTNWDFHSATVLEQTARIYDTINQLIDEYNRLVQACSDFSESEQESREDFELKLTKVIREFICSWEQKTTDLETFAETIINEAIQNGKISITEHYNPETESLSLVVGGIDDD